MKCPHGSFSILLLFIPLFCSKAMECTRDHSLSESFYRTIVQVPDTLIEEDVINILLPTIHISGILHRPLSKSERYVYWRRVRDVKKVLPIAEDLTRMITETYEYSGSFPTNQDRRDHLLRLKKDLIKEYTPKMKDLTLTQGLLLIKLINRQTGSTGYEIVKSIYGGFSASWYNTLAKFYGGDLDVSFDPEHVEDDAVTERIIYLWRHGLV